MTNKLQPVSKAAAVYFMSIILHGNEERTKFLIAHGLLFGKTAKDDTEWFAAFCRGVADQLNPRESDKERLKRAFLAGYDGYLYEEIKGVLTDRDIERGLRAKGLIDDPDNEFLTEDEERKND